MPSTLSPSKSQTHPERPRFTDLPTPLNEPTEARKPSPASQAPRIATAPKRENANRGARQSHAASLNPFSVRRPSPSFRSNCSQIGSLCPQSSTRRPLAPPPRGSPSAPGTGPRRYVLLHPVARCPPARRSQQAAEPRAMYFGPARRRIRARWPRFQPEFPLARLTPRPSRARAPHRPPPFQFGSAGSS